MQREELKQKILASDSIRFCREFLFSSDAWIFDKCSGKELEGNYHDFRCTISEMIDENPNNVAIVGSAKYGFSLKPNNSEKAFQAFHVNSDVDIVIISQRLFLEIWNGYRTAYYNGYHWLKNKHSKDIFRNFVVLYSEENAEYKSKYLRKVCVTMQEMQREVGLRHRINHPIKFRVYATWQDAENYHSSGIEKLKKEIKNDNQ